MGAELRPLVGGIRMGVEVGCREGRDGWWCQVKAIPLDGAVVLVDEVPGLAQQLLGGRGALAGPALQFPWKYQGAQAASRGAWPILGGSGEQRWRELGAHGSGLGQGAGDRGEGAEGGMGSRPGLRLEIGVRLGG